MIKTKRIIAVILVFLRFGLDEFIPNRHRSFWMRAFVSSVHFFSSGAKREGSRGRRLRLALETLGPVYIKFGQMMSTRRDLLPDDVARELSLLQDRVAPFSSAVAEQTILEALEIDDISELFEHFEPKPLASASIAQVHTAILRDNQAEVVLKVLRPNVRQIIVADVELMMSVARLLQRILPDGKRLRPVEVVKEYQRTILDELNLLREAANGIQIRRNFDGSDALYVPHFYSELCRKNLIVMERIYGIPVSDVARLVEQGTDLKRLAERGVEVFFTQVFRDSFFHADMHPGNIFVAYEHPNDPKYIGIDFGIVGTLNREDKRYLAENFIAFFNRDYRKVAELHVDSGWVPSDTNIDDFEMAIRTVCEPIFQKPLAEISFGNVLLQLFNTARRFNMVVQPQLVLLQKTLLYVEGLGRTLYPQLDLWQTAKPFLENWMQQQVGPKALWGRIKQDFPYWTEKFPEMPDLIFNYLKYHQQTEQRIRHQDYLDSQRHESQSKLMLLSVIGGTSLIASVLCLIAAGESAEGLPFNLISAAAGLLTLVSWGAAWRISSIRT